MIEVFKMGVLLLTFCLRSHFLRKTAVSSAAGVPIGNDR